MVVRFRQHVRGTSVPDAVTFILLGGTARSAPQLTFDPITFKLFFLLTLLHWKSVGSVWKDAPIQR